MEELKKELEKQGWEHCPTSDNPQALQFESSLWRLANQLGGKKHLTRFLENKKLEPAHIRLLIDEIYGALEEYEKRINKGRSGDSYAPIPAFELIPEKQRILLTIRLEKLKKFRL